jgi:hypothetical protein
MNARDADGYAALKENVACLYARRDETCEKPAPEHGILYDTDLGGFGEPAWIERIKNPVDRERARLRFYVRLAAYYGSEEGTLTSLSVSVGLNPRVLSTYTCRGAGRRSVSARVAKRIEKACGGVVRREQLCPDAFND